MIKVAGIAHTTLTVLSLEYAIHSNILGLSILGQNE